MSETAVPSQTSPPADPNPVGTYVLVLVVEALVIAALVWLGAYFD